VAGGHSYYTVETHIRHLGEMKQGEAFHTTTQILGTDAKRIRLLHRIHGGDGGLRATAEQMLVHVDMQAGRAAPAAPEVLAALAAIAEPHRALPIPAEAGRGIADLR